MPDVDIKPESGETNTVKEIGVSKQGKAIGRKPGKNDSKNNKRKLKWDIPHVIVILCIFLSYLYQYDQQDRNVFIYIVILTVSVGVTTAIVWRFMAIYTIEAFDSVFDLLRGKHSMICQIKSPQSETRSLLDHLYMAVEWAFFPTLVVFFVLSFIAGAITPEGKAVTEMWWAPLLMFLIPPLITFITIPIRLLADSSFMRYDVQNRILEPFGLTFQRMFRAVGGVGALASFAKVSLEKGGIEGAIGDTFTILLYVFPTLFIATLFYGAWHPQYLRKVEEKIDKFDFHTYSLEKDDDGILRLTYLVDEIDNTEIDMEFRFDTTKEGMPFATPLPPIGGIHGQDQYGNTVLGNNEKALPTLLDHQVSSTVEGESGVHGVQEEKDPGGTVHKPNGKNVFRFGEVGDNEDDEDYLDMRRYYETENNGKQIEVRPAEESMNISEIRAFDEEEHEDTVNDVKGDEGIVDDGDVGDDEYGAKEENTADNGDVEDDEYGAKEDNEYSDVEEDTVDEGLNYEDTTDEENEELDRMDEEEI